jgi:chain length determinant protein (polysaccharide antigen chain regulator)
MPSDRPASATDPGTSPVSPNGEINLMDLWRYLVQGKKTIILTALATGVLATVALLTFPSYQAEAHLLPPSPAEIEPLNVAELAEFSADTVFVDYLLRLQSRSLHRRVLEKLGVLEPSTDPETRAKNDEIFKSWRKEFLLAQDWVDPDHPGITKVSINGKDPQLLAEFINTIVDEAQTDTLDSLKQILQVRISGRREELKRQISSSQARAKQERLDEIIRLTEQQTIAAAAINGQIDAKKQYASLRRSDRLAQLAEAAQIAEAANIVDPLIAPAPPVNVMSVDMVSRPTAIVGLEDEPSSNLPTTIHDEAEPNLGPSSLIHVEPTPLAYHGKKVLNAEIKALQNRSSDDAFIQDLRPLQEMLQQVNNDGRLTALSARSSDDPFIHGLRALENQDALLEGVVIPESGLAAVRIDQVASPSNKPLRGLLYVLPAIIAGALLGAFRVISRRISVDSVA